MPMPLPRTIPLPRFLQVIPETPAAGGTPTEGGTPVAGDAGTPATCGTPFSVVPETPAAGGTPSEGGTPVAGDAGTPATGGTSDNAPVGVSAGSDASTLLLPRSRPVRIRTIPLPLPDGKDVHDHIPFKPNMLDPANISSGGFILPPWTIDIPTLMPLLLSMPYRIHEKESKLLHDGPYVHMAWKAYNTIFLPYCFLCGRWASIDHFAGKTHSDSKAVYYAKHDVMYRIEEHAMAPLLTIDESAPLEADSWV